MEQLTKEELAFLYESYQKNQSAKFAQIKQNGKIKPIYIFYLFVIIVIGWLLLFM
ncbi:MAG TPA: hypothetical protein GX503_08370 [Clostridiales bacterium]|nr:hypothetical protein [Clostridiales bacterium]